VRQPAVTLPVIGVKTVEFTPLPEPLPVKAIASPDYLNSAIMKVGVTLNSTEKLTLGNTDPALIKPYVTPVTMGSLAPAYIEVESKSGATLSLNGAAKELQLAQKTAPTGSTPSVTEFVKTQAPTLSQPTSTFSVTTKVNTQFKPIR
jgi:hypothetical protein